MAIGAITGKACTLTVGSLTAEGWVTNMDTSVEKATETVATWGEDVTYNGSPTYSSAISGLFDPADSSLGALLEAACVADTPVTLTVDLDGAARVLTGYLVNSYSDSAPADGLVTFEAAFTGSVAPATTYVTTP